MKEENKIRFAAALARVAQVRGLLIDQNGLAHDLLERVEQDLMVIAIDEFSALDLRTLIFDAQGEHKF